MIELRPYQREAIDAIKAYWADGGGNPLVDMATGTGKSLVIATLAREMIEAYPDMRILMLVHVRELVQQNATALLRTWPQAPIGINSAGLGRRDLRSKILFCSIQSVYKHDSFSLGPRDLILIDESHLIPHAGEGMYRTLIEKLKRGVPDMRLAGFTATPYRLGSGRLDMGDGRLFDDVVYSYGIGRGVADGYLAPLVSRATDTKLAVDGVRRSGGEFVAGALADAVGKQSLVDAATREIVARGADRKSWLIFCAGVQHAQDVADCVTLQGVECGVVTGDMPMQERDAKLRAFKAGKLRALSSVGVLTTGFDAPSVDLIALLRPTLSTGLYVQQLGRGTRLAHAKENCLVLDFAGNVRRHGPVDDIIVTGRGGAKEKDDGTAVKPDTVRAKECPNCGALVALRSIECRACGYAWPAPKPTHDEKPDTESAVMALGRAGPRYRNVNRVLFDRHEKPGGTPSLRVEYRCGVALFREWVTIEHTGFARERALAWWRAMGGNPPPPRTVDEALARQAELDAVIGVTMRQDGDFWRVSGWRVRRRDGAIHHIDERFRVTQERTLLEAAE